MAQFKYDIAQLISRACILKRGNNPYDVYRRLKKLLQCTIVVIIDELLMNPANFIYVCKYFYFTVMNKYQTIERRCGGKQVDKPVLKLLNNFT
jgi:hypothetical protein